MSIFERIRNQKLTFAANTGDTTGETSHTLNQEQWDTIVEALALDSDATADDVVAAVTALAETTAEQIKQAIEDQAKDNQPIAASRDVEPPVVIDAKAWKDMQRHVKAGIRQDSQEQRLAAEQVVDQAIRLSKASPTQREHWIAAYERDPESTVHALNQGKEIPRMEIGYGLDPFAEEGSTPSGWVR